MAAAFITLLMPGIDIGILVIVFAATLPTVPAVVHSTGISPDLEMVTAFVVLKEMPVPVWKMLPRGTMPLPLTVTFPMALMAFFRKMPCSSARISRYSPQLERAKDAL